MAYGALQKLQPVEKQNFMQILIQPAMVPAELHVLTLMVLYMSINSTFVWQKPNLFTLNKLSFIITAHFVFQTGR